MSYHDAAFADGKLFVAGGVNPGDQAAEVWFAAPEADGAIRDWKLAGRLPEPRVAFAIAAGGGRLYLAGGVDGTGTSVVSASVASNGTLGAWRTEPSLPYSRRGPQLLYAGRRLIVAGGTERTANNVDKRLLVADLSVHGVVGAWRRIEQPAASQAGATAVIARGRLYMIVDGKLVSIPLADLDAGTWTAHGPVVLADIGRSLFSFYLDGMLGIITNTGRVVTAPLAADGSVGGWRRATRFDQRPVIVTTVAVGPTAVWKVGGGEGPLRRGVASADVASSARD